MARKPSYTNPPLAPMNQWVRDALEHGSLSFPKAAEILTRAGLGEYERSKIQKMTVGRKVSVEEAMALSRATGFPLPQTAQAEAFQSKLSRLSEADRRVVEDLVDRLSSGASNP